MGPASKDEIRYRIYKKWKEKLPERERAYDLQEALNSIKQELAYEVRNNLENLGISSKFLSDVGDVVGDSIEQMVAEMLKEIETEDETGGF